MLHFIVVLGIPNPVIPSTMTCALHTEESHWVYKQTILYRNPKWRDFPGGLL